MLLGIPNEGTQVKDAVDFLKSRDGVLYEEV
jgi:hypothetical protein